jgi:hypothetical protein
VNTLHPSNLVTGRSWSTLKETGAIWMIHFELPNLLLKKEVKLGSLDSSSCGSRHAGRRRKTKFTARAGEKQKARKRRNSCWLLRRFTFDLTSGRHTQTCSLPCFDTTTSIQPPITRNKSKIVLPSYLFATF